MEFHDWYQWFSRVVICRIINNDDVIMRSRANWYQYYFHGKWEGQLMGGANSDSIMHNPQVQINSKQ